MDLFVLFMIVALVVFVVDVVLTKNLIAAGLAFVALAFIIERIDTSV